MIYLSFLAVCSEYVLLKTVRARSDQLVFPLSPFRFLRDIKSGRRGVCDRAIDTLYLYRNVGRGIDLGCGNRSGRRTSSG